MLIFIVQNELKLTSGHLKVQNFSGGYTPGPPRGGEMEGTEGKGKERIEEREGQDEMTKEGKTSACTPWGLWCRQYGRAK